MRFCPNCGAQLPDSAKFCTTCGEKLAPMAAAQPAEQQPQYQEPQYQEPQYQQSQYQEPQYQQYQGQQPGQPPFYGTPVGDYQYGQAPEPKKKKGKGLIIGAAALVGACAVGGGAFFLLRSKIAASPSEEFLRYHREVILNETLDQMEEGLDLLGKGKFSSDMTVSAEVDAEGGMVGGMISSMTKDSSIGVKVDAAGSKILVNADLNLMGSPILDGIFTYDAGKMGFYIPALDDTYYTADVTALLQKNGVDVDLSKVSIPEFTGAEWRAIADDYIGIFCSAVTDDNITKETKQDFTLERLGGDFTGTVYTWDPTAEDIQKMLEAFADHLEEDEDLKNAVFKVANPEVVDMFMAASGDSSFSFEEELDRQLKETAADIRDNAEEAGKDLEESEFVWTLSVADNAAKEIRLSNKNGTLIVFEFDGDKEKEFSTAIYTEASDGIDTVGHYTKDGSVYKGETTSKTSEGDMKVTFEYDKDKKSVFGMNYGTYDINMDALMGSTVSVEVSESENGGVDHIFRMDNLSGISEGYVNSGSLTLNATDSSTAKEPASSVRTQDITDWSPSQLEQLFEKMGQSMEYNVLPNITSAIGF